MNTLDIIILIFLACVVIYAISFNVNNNINDKLSNVAINIPPITIPPAQITVKVQKANGLNDSYDVFIERQKDELKGQVVALSPIEGFSETSLNVSQSESELHKVKEQSDKVDDKVKNQVNQVNNQVNDQVNNQYDKSKQIKVEPETNKQPMCNKSILNNRINAYGQLIQNSRGINEYKYPMCSSNCYDNILSDDGSEDYVVKEYKKYQQYVKTYLEDPIIRGANVNDYDNLSNIENIGRIDLSNGEIQPRPAGYVFQTSPAYNR